MSLVNDDQREVIGSKTPPPGFAHQGLHGGNDDRRIKTGRAFGRLDLGHDTGGPQNLVSRLFEKFLAMGNEQECARVDSVRRSWRKAASCHRRWGKQSAAGEIH